MRRKTPLSASSPPIPHSLHIKGVGEMVGEIKKINLNK
jgi:hypothetical protein